MTDAEYDLWVSKEDTGILEVKGLAFLKLKKKAGQNCWQLDLPITRLSVMTQAIAQAMTGFQWLAAAGMAETQTQDREANEK